MTITPFLLYFVLQAHGASFPDIDSLDSNIESVFVIAQCFMRMYISLLISFAGPIAVAANPFHLSHSNLIYSFFCFSSSSSLGSP